MLGVIAYQAVLVLARERLREIERLLGAKVRSGWR